MIDLFSDFRYTVSEVIAMPLTRIKTQWPERAGFELYRPDTGDEYIFLHFLSPAEVAAGDAMKRAEAGTCIFFDKHDEQYFRALDAPLLHDWFHWSGDLTCLFRQYGLQFHTLYPVPDPHRVTGILQSMEREFIKNETHAARLCTLRLEELLIALHRSREIRDIPLVSPDIRRRFYALRTKVLGSYQEAWDTEAMAAEVFLSQSQFYRIYKYLFGISPRQDLLETRIEHARILLQNSQESIDSIASLCGFHNPYHFIRQFKAKLGCPPGKYRKTAYAETRPGAEDKTFQSAIVDMKKPQKGLL